MVLDMRVLGLEVRLVDSGHMYVILYTRLKITKVAS